MNPPAPEFIRQATILWCGYAIQERKKSEGEKPHFTISEVHEQRKRMGLADRVRVYEIAADLERGAA